jgi:hypothetical protein
MNGRTIARVMLAVVLVGGAVLLGLGAYNAGVTQGLISSGQVGPGGYPVAPYVGGWGYGWGYPGGFGFGFFGFLGMLLFIFLLIGLFRAAFGRGRGWGPGPGRWDRSDRPWGRDAWEGRVREVHDELHRSGPATKATDDSDLPKT